MMGGRILICRSRLRSVGELIRRSWCSSRSDETRTHFGFQEVKRNEKENLVKGVFSSVASSYDVMNDAMSVGMHRLWKDRFVSCLGPSPEMNILDVAAGTGDISQRIISRALQSRVNLEQKLRLTVTDINPDMLAGAEKRLSKFSAVADLNFQTVNAEKLPFEDSQFDVYTIAFGIRNVTDIPAALKEAHRVLKPGGRFLCLEFSDVSAMAKPLYDLYSFQVIPVMGQVIANDWHSYQYLVESIRQFPGSEDFQKMVEEAGFKHVTHERLTLGVVAIHSGFKL